MEDKATSIFLEETAKINVARSIENGLPMAAACVAIFLLVDLAANICTDNN